MGTILGVMQLTFAMKIDNLFQKATEIITRTRLVKFLLVNHSQYGAKQKKKLLSPGSTIHRQKKYEIFSNVFAETTTICHIRSIEVTLSASRRETQKSSIANI